MPDYRIDQQTGAVIFKKTAEQKKAQQLEQRVEKLEKEVEFLRKSQRKRKWLRR